MNDRIIKYFSGALTTSQKQQLLDEIDGDAQLKAEFIQFQNVQGLSMLMKKSDDDAQGKSKYLSFSQEIKRKAHTKLTRSLLQYAAVALIFIASTVWATLFFIDNNDEQALNTLYVPAGQRAQITLQDGTQVWLNAQSTLKYPAKFSRKNRKVEVVGEAFFDVSKDEKRPFVVETQMIHLQVLGTKFNLYSYPHTGYVETALVEGSLKVSADDGKNSTHILKPNEQLTFKNNKISVGTISNPEHLLWTEGVYAFDNERLIDIIEKLELYYDITIRVENPQIFNVRYTGKFRQRDGIEEILRILQKIQPFKIERDRDNNTITLSK